MRAGILTGDVTLHILRHTALSRMVAAGHDDYTVMALSGHSSTRMLGALHPSQRRSEAPGPTAREGGGEEGEEGSRLARFASLARANAASFASD